MSISTQLSRVAPGARARLTAGLGVGVAAALTGGLMTATAGSAFASASADRVAPTMDRHVASRTLDLGLGPSPVAARIPPLLRRSAAPGPLRTGRAKRTGMAGGAAVRGTDTRGGDGSAGARDLALAATWQIDPTLLQPRPGDSAATLEARATLAAVAGHLHVVMDRYNQAHAAAEDAAAASADAQVELEQARVDAAAAHRVYVRDHRLLIQLVIDNYEGPPVTSIQFLLTADNARDLTVGMGTMQQVGYNQSSVVTDAEASAAKMRETAARARRAAGAARTADQKASDALATATDAGQQVLDQLAEARRVLTLSVLADQMRTTLAEAMKYANQLRPGSVSFPLPRSSGYYDNHNWGERSGHWASIHTGDDYSVACGTPVLAATAGTVEILTNQAWAGSWLVMISTGRGKLTTWYAHMEALAVTAGQHVKPGQVIGEVGQEGNATGCHLHFELHPDGGSIYQDTTDPDPWLKAVGAYPGS